MQQVMIGSVCTIPATWRISCTNRYYGRICVAPKTALKPYLIAACLSTLQAKMGQHGHCELARTRPGCFGKARPEVPTLAMERLKFSQLQIVVNVTTVTWQT